MPAIAADRIASHWLETLQEIADRSGHELRGALNGVAVNVEVVRARSVRATGEVATLAPFAAGASEQMTELTRRVEALLSIARRAREPFDVRDTLDRLIVLLGAAARSEGGTLRFETDGDIADTVTSAPGSHVRLVLGRMLLVATQTPGDVTCRLASQGAIIVELRGPSPFAVPGEIGAIAAEAGIQIEQMATRILMRFPVAPR